MATHSSILAWRIPWTEEPGGLQYVGSERVRHGWVTNTTIRKEDDGKPAKHSKQLPWPQPWRVILGPQSWLQKDTASTGWAGGTPRTLSPPLAS